jgi:hypothetical protein
MKYKIGDILKTKVNGIESMITRIDKNDNTYYLSNRWEPEYHLDENYELLTPHEDEPLIKDEKVRKAVRAWAEANGYGKDEVYEFEDFSTGWKSWSLEHKVNGDDNEIHFNGGIDFDKVEHQGYYTIDELCGEEE